MSWRHGSDLGVVRADNTTVAKINQSLDSYTDVTQPAISEMITVSDVTRQLCYRVVVFTVNSHLIRRAKVGTLLKFSDRRYAPYRATKLGLATPAYYRRKESVDSGFGDPDDGSLTMDATPWAQDVVSNIARQSGSVPVHNPTAAATVTFTSPEEPWIYCTSIAPANVRDTAQLRVRFSRCDATTKIVAPEVFAMQMGIDFAIDVDMTKYIVISPIGRIVNALSRISTDMWKEERQIDKSVCVYHGPVLYEHNSRILRSLEDFSKPGEAHKAWFTKSPRFSDEREYRFAVSVVGGRPRDDIYDLAISENLRRLTARVE